MQITKTYLHNICVGDFYQFKLYKVVDAAHQVWYIAEPVGHGAVRLGDTIEEVQKQLEKDVPILNRFLQKTR